MVTLVLLLATFTVVATLESLIGPPGARRPRRANLVMAVPTLVAGIGTDVLVAAATTVGDEHRAGLLPWLGLSGVAALIAGVVVLDLLAYLNHRLRHVAGPLWALHRTHHTDVDVDFSTSLRFHPLDVVVLNLVLAATVAGAGIGAAALAVIAVTTPLLGVFAHARISLPPRLERALALVVQTPGLHRVHHAPDRPRTDSNFGLVLTVWDRLLGTYNAPDITCPTGLDTVDLPARQSIAAMLAEPWRPLVKDGSVAGTGGRRAAVQRAG